MEKSARFRNIGEIFPTMTKYELKESSPIKDEEVIAKDLNFKGSKVDSLQAKNTNEPQNTNRSLERAGKILIELMASDWI